MDILPVVTTLRRYKLPVLLLILEIALTGAIVSNAVFLIGQRLQRMNIASGVAEHELVTVRMAYISNRPPAVARAEAETDMATLRRIAGVKQVALVNDLPFGNSSSNGGVKLDPHQQHATANAAEYYGQNLLPTLGVRLVAGRDFRPDDYVDFDTALKALHSGNLKGLPQTLIITRALAERLWPEQSALGRTIYMGDGIPFRVIGVIARLLRPERLNSDAGYSIVMPIRESLNQHASFLIRCAPPDRQRVLKSALAQLKQLDPNRVVLDKHTLDDMRHAFFAGDRAMAGILVGVCMALLVVTALGIVGLASFWVTQRTRQIGIRRAVGATRGDILRYFQAENFMIVSVGIALGMLLALGLNLALMKFYEFHRLPLYYLPVGAIALWVLGQLAVLSPAMRAAAVPPVVATRSV